MQTETQQHTSRRGRPNSANPKSNAQRQRDYRLKRRSAGDNGESNLNVWIDNAAKFALERLSIYRGLTERETLEQLIISADQVVLSAFGNIQESYDYLDKKSLQVTKTGLSDHSAGDRFY